MSKHDVVKSAVLLRQPTGKNSTGISREWQEKYAVLTTSYWAYYESGTQFQRHRQRPVFKIDVSSLLDFKTLPEMNEGKHAIQIIWSNDYADREEMLLGFHDKQQQLRWSKHLEEQFRTIREKQVSLAPSDAYKRDISNKDDEDDYDCDYEYMPYNKNTEQQHDSLYVDVRQSQSTEEEYSELPGRGFLRTNAHSLAQQSSEDVRITGLNESERVSSPETEAIKEAGTLKRGMIVKAVYSFEAEEDDELDIDKGDMIEITRDCNPGDGWCHGRLKSNYEVGLFPVNYVVATSQAELPEDISEDPYQAMQTELIEADDYSHLQDNSSDTMAPGKLQQGMKNVQRTLLDHAEALSRMVAFHDSDEAGTGINKRTADIDTAQRLRKELDCLSQRQGRTQKRLDQAISERNSFQSQLKAAEDKIETLQSLLEGALGESVVQKEKLAKLEQHQILLSLRTSERDELRYFLAEAERLIAKQCDQIITLSQEISKAKVAYATALEEKDETLTATKAAMNEEKQRKEMLGKQLTVTTKSYNDRLSQAEIEVGQLKRRVRNLKKQTKEKTTKLADTQKRLATAREELASTTDGERNLVRQLGRLNDDLDTIKNKYETAVAQTRIAEKQVAAAKQEIYQLREILEKTKKSQTGSTAIADEDQQNVIERLQLRVKELEEMNNNLEQLQVLRETRTSKK